MVALCFVFILILMEAGYFDREVRVLHVFQSLIYVAVIVLSLRHNKWGYGIGLSIAVAWNALNLLNGFVFDAGFREWASFLRTGHITNPVWWVAPPAWFVHVALIICLISAYLRLPTKKLSDIAILIGSFVLTIGYFLLIIAIFFSQFLPRLKHTLFG